MTHDGEWEAIRGRQAPWLGVAGTGMLRIALLFGSAAVALALILTPLAARHSRTNLVIGGLDHTATGAIGDRASYTIRRSVLQDAGAVCIIRADGRRSGDC